MDCEQYAKLGCNYVMQWNLQGWSVATAKKKTAVHTFYTCLLFHLSAAKACYTNEPAESDLQCQSQFAKSGQISEFRYFCPSKFRPCTVPPGADAPLRPPSRRHWCRQRWITYVWLNCRCHMYSCCRRYVRLQAARRSRHICRKDAIILNTLYFPSWFVISTCHTLCTRDRKLPAIYKEYVKRNWSNM